MVQYELGSMSDWPPGHAPEGAAVFAHNELRMSVPPERVWAWLVRADRWNEYYGNAHWVRIVNGPGPGLAPGTTFKWVTFNAPITSTVIEFEPYTRIGWDFRGLLGARGYHRWLLEPSGDGCRVVTEETQRGWAIRLVAPLMRSQLLKQHQRWLEALERVAAAGEPRPST